MSRFSRARDRFAGVVREVSGRRVGDAYALQKVMDQAFSKMGEAAKQVIVEVLLEEFAQLQASTPYDTGRAQAGWLISGEGSSWGFIPAEGQATYQPQRPSEGSLMRSDVIFVINNVEYILYLEAGWSKRQPGGFVANFLNNCKRRIAAECAAMSRTS
jgi:hypothetical protein